MITKIKQSKNFATKLNREEKKQAKQKRDIRKAARGRQWQGIE